MNRNEKVQLGYTQSEHKVFKKNAWIYLLMFSLLYCFLYCARLNISSATPFLIENGWSEATIGIMTGTLFWTYGIGQLINGRLCEVVGPSKLIVSAVVGSAIANFLVVIPGVDSLVLLAVIWGANGLFQSMAWTPGLATLTKWWPGESRGFATGFLNAFSGFGQVAAYCAVIVAYTGFSEMGWKVCFMIPPIFPLVVLVLYLLIIKDTPEKAGLRDYEESNQEKTAAEQQMREIIKNKGVFYPYKYILSDKKFIIWILIAFFSGLARYGLSTWIPLYFTQQGFSAVASVASSLLLPIGMGFGTLVVPWITDRFCPHNRMPAAISSAIVGAVATIVLFVLDASDPMQMFLVEAMLFVAGFCIYAINGIIFTYATDIGGRVFSGTCSGVLNFSAYLGAAVQSVVYGFILNYGGWEVVFVSITVINVLIAFMGSVGSRKIIA